MKLATIVIQDLLRDARSRGASDVHFGGPQPPIMRVDGRLISVSEAPVQSSAIDDFLLASVDAAQYERLRTAGTADGSAPNDEPGAPYRVHAYRYGGGIRVAIRLLADRIPTLESLQLPAAIAAFAELESGLILFAGPAGSGKTTALAALIDHMNRTSERVIVTVEDPVEYMHSSQRSAVTHCEIGRDVSSYAEALRGFMRADPDVILIGEMRDRATMEAALTAAETGHLVLATLHTHDAAQTIDRIVDAFPGSAQMQIRSQLASTLAGVAALRLISRRNGPGRRAAAEILVRTDAVRALIRDGKSHQIRNAIITGRSVGMQTLETHLSDLVLRGEIRLADARAVTSRPHEVGSIERSQAS